MSGSELSYQSISLACVKLSLFVVFAVASMYVVARITVVVISAQVY